MFEQGCGIRSAEVIGELIKKAFEDPRYLRFKYRADCTLHDSPPDVDAVTAPRVRPSSTSGDSTKKRTSVGTRVPNNMAAGRATSGESRTVVLSVELLSMAVVLWRIIRVT